MVVWGSRYTYEWGKSESPTLEQTLVYSENFQGFSVREKPTRLPWLVVCWGFVGDEILASYMGIVVNYCKDPY